MPKVVHHCGHDHTTRFCGYCGAELQATTPLGDLLIHCRSEAERYKAIIDNPPTVKKGKAAGTPMTPEETEKSVRRATQSFQQWDKWANALVPVTENGEPALAGVGADDEDGV